VEAATMIVCLSRAALSLLDRLKAGR
jgi:hypothetical protein